MNKFMKTNKKIEKAVVTGYKAIENGVVSGYKGVENSVVEGYKKMENKFVDTFLASDKTEQDDISVDDVKTNAAENDEINTKEREKNE